jgi:hypothetical protein
MIARTQRIYSGAIQAYQDLVEKWFPAFQDRFLLSVTLPARFIGVLSRVHDSVWINFKLEPLPKEQVSIVEVSFGNVNDSFWDESLLERLRSVRPKFAEWILPFWSSQHMDHYLDDNDPMTKQAYEWLKNDLKRIHWFD